MQNTPLISIVIPVKNGVPWLDACIKGIMSQTLFHQTEIIAIDSGSTDETISLLKKYPVRVYHVPPAEFNHGLTRNYGVELGRGEYVVMTVQDARPTDELWLQKLLNGFSAADNVAGVCGSQVVAHSRHANPVDWFRPVDEPKMVVHQYKSSGAFDALTPRQQMQACGWDDVNAMYKRSALLEIPFRKISYGEDAVWAKEALLAGHAVVYNPAARVYHYHLENEDFVFRRTLTVMHLRYRQFGCIYNRPSQTLRQQLSIIKTILFSKPLSLKERWRWYQYNRQQLKGQQRAFETFQDALAKGEEALDAVHEKYCGKPPSPLKPVNKHEPALG